MDEERTNKDSLKAQMDALDEQAFGLQKPGYVDMVNSVDFALRNWQVTVVSGLHFGLHLCRPSVSFMLGRGFTPTNLMAFIFILFL